nr:hypothetical protein [Tanacetum cinerariifolium]
MNLIATQQAALDNDLVPHEKRPKIERCNARITFCKPQREETYQVTLEALKLSPCYPRFVITAVVLEIYMHQFWTTIKKIDAIKNSDAYNFKLEKRGSELIWKSFVKFFRCVPEFSTKTLLHHLQKKNWLHSFRNLSILIDFTYQADNREISSARKDHMPYPRFTKVIINYFISKDKTIFMRNRIKLHTIHDESLLGTLKFVSKTQDYQQYGALMLDDMINQDVKDSEAYKTYYDFATRTVPSKKARKYKKVVSPSRKLSNVKEAEPVKKGKRVNRPAKKSTTTPPAGVAIRDTLGVSVSKKKAPDKSDKSKGIKILSDVALWKAAQLKEATKRSKKDFHISQANGSGDGTDLKSGVPNEKQRKTSGDSEDDNDDDNDDYSKGDDDKADSDDDGNSDADDNERTNSDDDDDENPSFTLKDYDEEEHDDEYESNDDNENVFEEEVDDLYKDVDVRSLGVGHEKEREGVEEMTDDDQMVFQAKSYDQVVEDAHVTLTSSQKTESLKQSSSVSSDFASKFMIFDNVPPMIDEVASIMNIFLPCLDLIKESLPWKELSQLKQADHSTQLMESVKSQLPTMVDDLLSTRIRYATRIALESYTKDFEKKAQEERKLYIDVVEKSLKDIIKDEVKSILPQILPKEVSDFATPMIQSTINESLENVFLAKSSSQPKSTYEAVESLTEFELKKILLNKMEKSESYKTAPEHKQLYEGLVKSYNLDKDLFLSYGNTYSLKRDREDKDKDENPSAGSDRCQNHLASLYKQRNQCLRLQTPKCHKIKEVTQRINPKTTPMDDWFKKPNKPPPPDRTWNDGNPIDSRPPQKWITNIAKSRQFPCTFDELMSTPIDFSEYVMHNLMIDNLT